MRALLSPEGYSKQTEEELKYKNLEWSVFGDSLYVLKNKIDTRLYWMDESWDHFEIIPYQSIGDAVKKLKAHKCHWGLIPTANHRRAQLIFEQLPQSKEIQFSEFTLAKPIKYNSFGLINDKELFVVSGNHSPFVNGQCSFLENKTEAPSRAYLKLWEVFSRFPDRPTRQDRVIDFGACPGGWTWVLAKKAGHVIAIDKAPIDPRLLRQKNIEQIKHDGFTLDRTSVGKIDWFFSDIICDPNRLYELVLKWQESGVKKFVCTLKFKGVTDFDAIQRFEKIDGGELLHLHHNKHELTWVKF